MKNTIRATLLVVLAASAVLSACTTGDNGTTRSEPPSDDTPASQSPADSSESVPTTSARLPVLLPSPPGADVSPTQSTATSPPSPNAPTSSTTPASSTTPTTEYVHLVEAGDVLVNISELYRVPIAEIIEANGLENPDALQIGQGLTIPGYRDR